MARTTRDRSRSLRRLFLAGAAALTLASPALASGCGGGFDSISSIEGLRVLAVVADKPYAAPGETVTFDIDYFDGYVNPDDPEAGPRAVQVLWIGGCFNPAGDEYYACFDQLKDQFTGSQGMSAGDLPPGFGFGDKFQLTLPQDLVSSRPPPPAGTGPQYGIAYVFFAACAGKLGPITDDSFGRAGSFPIGCFDINTGARLGAESFVPGYTQIYSFADGRTNANPPVTAFTIDDEPVEEGLGGAVKVKRCDYDEERRDEPPSCGKEGPYEACQAYVIDVDVSDDVAEIDPDAVTPDGTTLREAVWVDYYAEKGDFDAPVMLVSDASTGLTRDHSAKWIAPPESGPVSLWAVVHDARGGATVLQRWVQVE